MANIRTVEELDDALSEAIVWRKKELHAIKTLIELNKTVPDRSNCLIRSGVALLYAHWEGFIKEAGIAYLEFVRMQNLSYEELAPNFIALAMRGKLTKAAQAKKAMIHNEVVEFFLTKLSEKGNIPSNSDAINTQSNLSSDVLENIIHTLGLDYAEYETQKEVIDEKLLTNRNQIAHGKYLVVDQKRFGEIHAEIIALMELFRNQVSNAAATGKYRRQPNPPRR
jgi:hypothetical protein